MIMGTKADFYVGRGEQAESHEEPGHAPPTAISVKRMVHHCDGPPCCDGPTRLIEIVPTCCEAARDGQLVFRVGSRGGRWSFSGPTWPLPGVHGHAPSQEARFCPFCGAPLPEMAEGAPPEGPVHAPDRDGDYCDTCGERSSACGCWPRWASWHPVGALGEMGKE